MESIEWRPFPDFEDAYLISNYGDVFSIRSNRILKPKVQPSGYLRVSPSIDGVRTDCAVHRMVALAFIPNPNNKPTVNHINENKRDNYIGNLEWATMKEQNNHGTRTVRARQNINYLARNIDYTVVSQKHDYHKINIKQMKPVLQFDKHGNFIARHGGINEAATKLGISAGHLCSCLKGRRHTCGGFQWKYE